MHVSVNGRLRPLEIPAPTVASLVEAMALAGRRIAVELNGEIVPKSRYMTTRLADGDRVEIVGAVGGG